MEFLLLSVGFSFGFLTAKLFENKQIKQESGNKNGNKEKSR